LYFFESDEPVGFGGTIGLFWGFVGFEIGFSVSKI
jgi:hypothetical protein